MSGFSAACYGIALFNVIMAIINIITGGALVLILLPAIVALVLASLTFYLESI